MLCSAVVWYDVLYYVMLWHRVICYDLIWYAMVGYGVVCYACAGLVLRACGCAEVVVGRLRGGALVIIRRQTALTHSLDLGSLSGSSLDRSISSAALDWLVLSAYCEELHTESR